MAAIFARKNMRGSSLFSRSALPGLLTGGILLLGTAVADDPPKSQDYFTASSTSTEGTAAGVSYTATAGTLVVHAKGWDDAAKPDADGKDKDSDNPDAEASMFFAAYVKKGETAAHRPIIFFYNGGPGAASLYLHMGAFGPRRVVTSDDSHTPAAPYQLVENQYTLLDVADLVFIDAPGTGFSRIEGKDKRKSFYGTDQDARAFTDFIAQFLSKYGRWNSPKYLFGESYGTPRTAAVINMLETDRGIDFNGVIMLSQILNFALGPDGADQNPGIDLPYVLALPSYAATAWYHDKLPGTKPADLPAFLQQVQDFAAKDYLLALQQGTALSDADRTKIANQLHQFTGLPLSYILRANLRIDGGEFEKNVIDDQGQTTGRFDTRFSGPTLDVLSKEADYDPGDSAISSAYVSAVNDYLRNTLKYPGNAAYNVGIDVDDWDFSHQGPYQSSPQQGTLNVMPDLAQAMVYNPLLKVMLNGGYFDLATPYFEGWYEMHHLAIPAKLQGNIEYHYYKSGHMVYAHEPSLAELHQNVAAFIRNTDNLK